jgi:hypothetical protein
LFSVADFSQVHWRAGCLPQEHLASFAQTHPPSRPQQVTGTAPVVEDIVIEGVGGCVVGGCIVGGCVVGGCVVGGCGWK